MKKIFALLLVLMMMFSLAACGNKDVGDNKGSSENSSNAETSQNASNTEGNTESNTENKDGFTALDVKKEQRISDMEITGMKMGKEKYAVDEPISVTVTWKGTPADDAWIGIIPAETPHGDEEKNDEYDVSYIYFGDMESGKAVTFENVTLEPGVYTLRVNESDAGGAELAWCGFIVA